MSGDTVLNSQEDVMAFLKKEGIPTREPPRGRFAPSDDENGD